MIDPEVQIVRTGTANLASVAAALTRLGAVPRLIDDAASVERARFLVLPGVGTLEAAMRSLRERGLVGALRERVGAGRPTLAICLGLQMLCLGSEESPGVEGIGVIPANASRFPAGLRVPQLGWNRIEPLPGCELLREGYAYFANSYRIERPVEQWSAAMADYGTPFVAALERGSVLACQFHPELSGAFGLQLIRRWLERSVRTILRGGAAC